MAFPSAIVLYGSPGCGKTFAVDRLADFLEWPCFRIDSGSIGSPYIHETSRKTAQIFHEAELNAPSMIVIDEMDAFLSDRTTGNSGTHHAEEVSEFLRRIPEAPQKEVRGLLLSLLEGLPLSPDVDLGAIAERLAGRPLSDAAFW